MRITLPDSLYDAYAAHLGTDTPPSAEAVERDIIQQLTRFRTLHPRRRALVLDVEAVEKLLGGMPIADSADLLRRLQQLAAIEFHRVKLDFSASQLAELKWRADRQGKSVEVLAAEILAHVTREFFYRLPDAPAAAAPTKEPAPERRRPAPAKVG